MHLELTTHVDAPPEDVWAVVADVERWPETSESMDAIQVTSTGDFGEGSTARVKQPGIPELTWTVTEWRPGVVFDWQTRAAGTTILASHRIEPDGTGTRLTLEIHQNGPLAPLLALVSGKRNRRYVAMELEAHKTAAEARAGRR